LKEELIDKSPENSFLKKDGLFGALEKFAFIFQYDSNHFMISEFDYLLHQPQTIKFSKVDKLLSFDQDNAHEESNGLANEV
jgi:hypothetical protein